MKNWSWLSLVSEWGLLTLSCATGGPALAIVLILLFMDKEPPKSAAPVILLVFGMVAAWGGWIQEHKARLRAQIKHSPRLKVGKSDFFREDGVWRKDYKTVGGDWVAYPDPECTVSYLILSIENDPDIGTPQSVASQIAPRLLFSDVNGKELFEVEGRWSIQHLHLRTHGIYLESKTVDIPVGTKRRLDTVVKHKNESECYAVNNDSYGQDPVKQPDWKLGPGEYLIRVRLRGANVDETFLLRFRNPEGNGSLEPLSCTKIAS